MGINRCRAVGLGIGCCGMLLVAAGGERLFAQPPNNPPQNVTIQLPVLGVSIDPAGVLKTELKQDLTGVLTQTKLAAARRELSVQVCQSSALRKISLRRLLAEVLRCRRADEALPEEVQRLAGLTQIAYVFLDPENQDVIVAGPAGAWATNLAEVPVSLENGQPVLTLDDLLTALRLFSPNEEPRQWLAVSIDPTADGLRRYHELQQKIPARISDSQRSGLIEAIRPELENSLGLANIQVYGLPSGSNLAHVLIAADYQMKLIGIGLEPPPVRLTTFLDAISGAMNQMQRWWLVPDYGCLIESPDRTALAIKKTGVQLLTEDFDLDGQGRLVASGRKPSRASRSYAASFTKHFEELAAKHAGFARLRQAVDWLIVAAWLQSVGAFRGDAWTDSPLFDPQQLPGIQLPEPKKAPCVANAVWKDRLLVMPVGGGVSIEPWRALQKDHLTVDPQPFRDLKPLKNASPNWWWD